MLAATVVDGGCSLLARWEFCMVIENKIWVLRAAIAHDCDLDVLVLLTLGGSFKGLPKN